MKRYAESRLFTHLILIGVALFLLIAILWANYAILDEVTTGQGKVIPSSQIQVIQNLEGGIVEKILVREGEVVQKNQILMQLDQTRFMSTVNEAKEKMIQLKLTVLRINAEMNKTELVIPPEIMEKYPEIAKAQQNQFQSERDELNQIIETVQSADKELQLSRPLVSKGAASEVEILRLERTVNEAKSKVSQFQSNAYEELNKSKTELASLESTHLADADRLTRTTVRSPVKGIVKRLKVNTLGGVIQPGMDMVEIVPLDDTLLIEAKIKPADVGFIHPGQDAMVKLTAYDFSIYGGLPGKVEQISADTITDDKNGKEEIYYLIRVRTEKNNIIHHGKSLYIIPGMMATVDILTGRKSVLHYLLKPIIKARDTALRER
jgi:adhesin transport system membrane fusion protein